MNNIDLINNILDQISNHVYHQIRDQIDSKIWIQVKNRMEDQLITQICREFTTITANPIRLQIWRQIEPVHE